MIGIKLNGRLGNQLFQYAFALSVSKKLSTNFYLDRRSTRFILPEYFNIKKDLLFFFDKYLFSIRGLKNIFTYHLRNRFYNSFYCFFPKETVILSNEEDPKDELKKIKNNVLYDGYFQSESYFANVILDVKKHFSIKKKYIIEYFNILSDLNTCGRKIVVVHIRRGDYQYLGLQLDLNYYHNAIKQLESSNYFYVFISDQPELILDEFNYLKEKYISRHSEIIDLQFLINANICILSNSSFSWWGAYLNPENNLIYAPKFWCSKIEGITFPSGIEHNLNWKWL